jgi:PAS domain S-box-containing protein
MTAEDTSLNDRLIQCEAALREETERRKAAERALHQARDVFRKTLLDLPVIICAEDQDGSLVFYNREFERVSGYAAQDLQDLPDMLEVLLREDAGPCIVNEASCRKWRIAAKDGREKVVVWSETSSAVPLAGWRSWKIGLDITELEAAREKVKILQGLLPICANCKKIRDERGVWQPFETYIVAKSEAHFTHGVCPDCMARLYPEADTEA